MTEEHKFIAVDGEGLSRDDGTHDYTLLAASDGSCIENWSKNGLGTEDCFDYLLGLKEQYPKAIFIAFSFGYDSNMMFRDMDFHTLERLHVKTKSEWIARKEKRYFVEFIPNKWLSISRTKFQGGVWAKDGTVKIWDVFGFYQQSFVRAMADWKAVDAEESDFIAEMKLKRGNFEGDLESREEIKTYCWRECIILEKLGNLLDEALFSAGIEIKQYHGAGAIANALLGEHRALDAIVREQENPELQDAILRAYFGGRIESFVVGYVEQAIYNYDINSAYPHTIRQLPNLQRGTWFKVTEYEKEARHALWRVSWSLGAEARLAPFPFRNDSSIYYCRKGEGWYHAPEVSAALDAGLITLENILEGFVFDEEDSTDRPFSWVYDIYLERLRAKSEGDKREKVLKLGMNSLYGKFAQGLSANDKPGRFQCYYYAGFITSNCRSMVLRAVAQVPDDIIAITTDGILSTRPIPNIEVGKGLGQWEAKTEVDDGLLVVQPGIVISHYESFVRTRGVDRSSVGFDTFMQAWRELGIGGKIKTNDTRFIGLGRALAGAKDSRSLNEKWRRWQSIEVDIAFYPRRKPIPFDADVWSMRDGYIKLGLLSGFNGISERYKMRGQTEVNQNLEVEPIEFFDSIRSG